MIISQIFAFIGAIITGIQALLILLQGNGICLNEGCEIVDNLTLVDPLYFNSAGCLFFLVALFSLQRARHGSEGWRGFASLILLAALGAEAVLFCFQYFVVDTFCSYCLIILALVVLTNFFVGIKQIFRGLVIFLAVTIAFASLNFSKGAGSGTLDSGVMARVLNNESEPQLSLFFSSSCKHCENILSLIENELTCSINFNPIDRIDNFSFPGIVVSKEYKPDHNIRLLQHLGLQEVPVLIATEANTQTVISGEQGIVAYLQSRCISDQISTKAPESIGQTELGTSPVIPADDGCSVIEDCDDQSSTETSNIGQSPANVE
ncbi:MAG: hypothetical protein D6B25_12545 [Desulfobulbaceae bacterium]|nr:MAG: hypothetical protein D6B25_12545 [Desulfobulbaceae bacterium]